MLSRELGRLDADVVAVDGSPKMIKAAKLETDTSHGRIFFKETATLKISMSPMGALTAFYVQAWLNI